MQQVETRHAVLVVDDALAIVEPRSRLQRMDRKNDARKAHWSNQRTPRENALAIVRRADHESCLVKHPIGSAGRAPQHSAARLNETAGKTLVSYLQEGMSGI